MPSTEPTLDSLCIIRLSAIGDCCHVLPVARTLQAAFPRTRITWIIGKVEHSLLEGADGIEFITFDKSLGMRGVLDVRRQLRGRRFPVLLHMHASMRANLVSMVVDAHRRIGFDRARARDRQWLFTNERIGARARQHVMDGFFEFAEHLGITQRTLRWDIPVPSGDLEYARKLADDSHPMVVISPCASQRFRNFRDWSPENYAVLVRHLQERHVRVVLTGAGTETERHYANEIERQTDDGLVNLVGKTSLKRLLAIIGRASVVVCPDSGPAHMAAATGTPVVGLYATSNRHRTGPYFSQDLVVDRYPDAVAQEFGKAAEELRWGQRVRNPSAMQLVGLGEVIEKVDSVLAGRYVHSQSRLQLPRLSDGEDRAQQPASGIAPV